jgi:hypothetical protein
MKHRFLLAGTLVAFTIIAAKADVTSPEKLLPNDTLLLVTAPDATMFLIGLWHGAAWTFVPYGILQATAMCVHRYFHRRAGSSRAPDPAWKRALKIVACLQFVVFSRILFRATSIDNAWEVVERLVSGTRALAQVSTGVWTILLQSFGAHHLPKRLLDDARDAFTRLPGAVQGVALATAAALLSLVATSQVVPYIYFQF